MKKNLDSSVLRSKYHVATANHHIESRSDGSHFTFIKSYFLYKFDNEQFDLDLMAGMCLLHRILTSSNPNPKFYALIDKQTKN